MKININDEQKKIYPDIPKRWKSDGHIIDGYHLLETEKHLEDGWIDFEYPEIDWDTHKLGNVIIVDGKGTMEVIEKPEDEIFIEDIVI